MDTQRLKELVDALRTADPKDDALFHRLLNEAMTLFGMMDKDLADGFGVSRPTVTRWKNGTNAPHPAMRPSVYSWLAKKAAPVLRREETRLRGGVVTHGAHYPMVAAGAK
jgi:transcriptional regulator with XRE-family HTH domain